MQILVVADPCGGERFVNRTNGKHCSLMQDIVAPYRWYIFQGGHPDHNLNKKASFKVRGEALEAIEILLEYNL